MAQEHLHCLPVMVFHLELAESESASNGRFSGEKDNRFIPLRVALDVFHVSLCALRVK